MAASINDQIKAELESSYLYLAMSTYLEDQNLKGMAHWLRTQAKEELGHVEKLMHYLSERGVRVLLDALAKPKAEFDGPLGVFRAVLAHERAVTERLSKMMDLAIEEKDHMTAATLRWFIEEQIEEESSPEDIVKKLEFVGTSNTSVYLLDKELAQR
jgi:ferritin